MKIVAGFIYVFAILFFAFSKQNFWATTAFFLFLGVGTLVAMLGNKSNNENKTSSRDSQNLEDLATIERARYYRKPLN